MGVLLPEKALGPKAVWAVQRDPESRTGLPLGYQSILMDHGWLLLAVNGKKSQSIR